MSAIIQLAQLVANVYAGNVALDAYNDHKDALEDSSNESLARAKARFKAEKKTKEKIPEAYKWLCETPEYVKCETRAPKIRVASMQRQYNQARQAAQVAAGKGMVGMRRRLAREATIGFIQETTINFDTVKQVEANIAKAYTDLRDTSIISSVQGVSNYDPSGVTARTNALLQRQLESQADAFNGAAGALGAGLQDLYNNRSTSAEPAPRGTTAADYSPEALANFNGTGSGTDPLSYDAEVLRDF